MLWRFRFKLKGIVDGTISLPIIVPEICLGVAMLIFFAWVEWPNNLIWPLAVQDGQEIHRIRRLSDWLPPSSQCH